jgi:Putative Ig domain
MADALTVPSMWVSRSLTSYFNSSRRTKATFRATMKRRFPLHLAVFSLMVILLSAAPKGVHIQTRDSLSVRQGSYSSLFFFAEPVRAPGNNLPVQYQFTESGATPPGMRFESYACNKPDMKVCPQIASSNGIFLDGTPSETGSYTFTVTATDGDRKGSQQFTIVVNAPDRIE